jgi:hypothetical protein
MFSFNTYYGHPRWLASLLLLGGLTAGTLISFPAEAQTDEPEPNVKLTTALGVQTEVNVGSITVEPRVLNLALGGDTFEPGAVLGGGISSTWLPICVAEGVYMGLPLDMVRSLSTQEGRHSVLMENGQRVEGKLIGELRTTNDKAYDLPGVVALEVLSAPRREESQETQHPRQTWNLNIPGKVSLSYTVVEPAFREESICPDDTDPSCHAVSSSFHLRVGGQDHLANIEDFHALTLTQEEVLNEGLKYWVTRMTVESNTGVKTSGDLLLAADWLLVARMASNHRILLAVSARKWTLRQKKP